VFDPLDFCLPRSLIPKPRSNLARYHGIYTPRRAFDPGCYGLLAVGEGRLQY